MKKRIIIFYLIIIPILSNAQMLADFESAEKTPSVSAEGSASVVDNPDKSGINTSNNVGYYDKLEGNWHYVSLEFDSPVEIGYNNTLKFKVRASEKGRVFAKFWNGENVLIEHWAPVWEFMPESGEWTECYMDLTPAMQKSFTKLQLAMCVDNEARADVYFDDVELTNPELASGYPKVIFTTSDTNINVGESIEFNASGSFDYDGEIASFLWDFNDGETADGAEVAHTFTHAGSYWVKVSVTDNDGKVSSDSTVVFVFGDGEIASDVLFTHANIGVNEKAEAIFQINKAYTNVFDPDEVKVDAHVKLPDNTMLTIPCFYYVRSYVSNTEWLIDNSFQGWMLRFSSHVSGEAEIQIEINDSEGSWSSSKQNVIIESGEEKGIIHVDSDNKQYYRHKTGETFNPMGINIGWNNIKDYTEIITNLSDYNANTFRYWHTPFAKQALEWKNDGFYQGLGIYNQQAAAMTDSLVNLGEDLEMFMQLVIFQHGMFSENVNEMWEDNPYNTKNGGYVTKAEEYFYNEQCKDQTKKLLRYIIARWGYAKNIFAWEFFNEVQFTGVYESQSNQWYPGVQQWHSEMCRYVESIDPFNHIMTTSAADGMLADFDTIKALDNIQYHLYHNQVLDEQIKLDYQFKNELGKSVVNGEYGLKTDAEMTFDGQRHAVWHGIFTEVPHFMWVWGHYLDTTWAKLFEMPAKYLEGEDLAVKNGLQSFSFDVDSEIEFESIGIRNNQFFGGYLYTSNTQQLLDDVVVKLQEIPYGYYNVTYYFSVEDKIEELEKVPFIELTNELELPDFTGSMAFKIEYADAYALPIAIAGNDTIIAPGNTLTFNGNRSVNPGSGNALTYNWQIIEKPEGSASEITGPTQEEIEFTPDISGLYRISLTVSDGDISGVPDQLKIVVSNSPVAVAGNDTTIENKGRYFYLDGSESYDPDGDDITYEWQIVEKPDGSRASLLQFNQADAILQFDKDGLYKCILTVNDGISGSTPDTILIALVPEGTISGKKEVYITENQVHVFPNPVKYKLWVKTKCPIKKLELYNNQGLLVNEKTVYDVYLSALNMYDLENGNVYFLKVFTESGISAHKVFLLK